MSDADWVMRVYDRHVPDPSDARMKDVVTRYTRSLMNHVLHVAEIAMRSENVHPDVRRRVLLTIAVGRPSSPVDAELRQMTTEQLLTGDGMPFAGFIAAVGQDAAAKAPTCGRVFKPSVPSCIRSRGHGPEHWNGSSTWYDHTPDD